MAKFLFSKGNQINKGRIPWNKGTHGIMKPNSGSFGNGQKGHTESHSEESKKKMSEAIKKAWASGKFKNRPRHSVKTRNKISETLHKLGLIVGDKCPNWKGGVTPENRKARQSVEMNRWRRMVFHRDGYTCRECGVYGVPIEAHHIKSFAEYPELRTSLDNGITVCVDCHCKIDKFRRIMRKRKNG